MPWNNPPQNIRADGYGRHTGLYQGFSTPRAVAALTDVLLSAAPSQVLSAERARVPADCLPAGAWDTDRIQLLPREWREGIENLPSCLPRGIRPRRGEIRAHGARRGRRVPGGDPHGGEGRPMALSPHERTLRRSQYTGGRLAAGESFRRLRGGGAVQPE